MKLDKLLQIAGISKELLRESKWTYDLDDVPDSSVDDIGDKNKKIDSFAKQLQQFGMSSRDKKNVTNDSSLEDLPPEQWGEFISKSDPRVKGQVLKTFLAIAEKRKKDRNYGYLRFYDVDFSGGDYSGISFEGPSMSSRGFGDKAIDYYFADCDFSNSNLSNAYFTDLHLGRSNFSSCDLSGATFGDVPLTGVDFTNANLKNTRFMYCPFLKSGTSTLLNNPTFEKEKWKIKPMQYEYMEDGEQIMIFEPKKEKKKINRI